MSIGKNIAKYRKKLRLTQEALGEKLGITNQSVSKWESEVSMPDIMLLPKIAEALGITLDDLFSSQTADDSLTTSDTLNMDGIHSFPKDAQAAIIDSLYRQSNLPNCGTWQFFKVGKNPLSAQYDRMIRYTTLCCLSDTAGAAFVSDDMTMIDARTSPADMCAVFKKPEITSVLRKLSDTNVRRVLSYVCDEYFHSQSPFDYTAPEYLEKDIEPDIIASSAGLTSDEMMDALEKLSSIHIVETRVEDSGLRYLLQKVKAVEAAVIFRLIERFSHNQVGLGCGELLALFPE